MRKSIVHFYLFYLRFFAKIALKISKPNIIGIAGSVGKSSTKEALYAILQDHFKTRFTSGNSETGVPLGILGIETTGYSIWHWFKILFLVPFKIFSLKGIAYLIVEMGTDDPFPPKNMEYLLTIVKPDIAVFLNTGSAHTMQFEKALSEAEKKQNPPEKLDSILKKMAHEDGKIITASGCKTAIYCSDNRYVFEEITPYQKKSPSTEFLTFGKSEKNNLFYGNYKVTSEETSFELNLKPSQKDISEKTDSPSEKITLVFKNYVLPQEYREVFGAATLIAAKIGLQPKEIEKSLIKNFTLPKGRASIFQGIKNSIIIDSSYNASRSAVEAFLHLCSLLREQTNRPLAFACGDMRELGDEAAQEHRAIAEKTSQSVEYLYCVGPLTKKYIIEALEKNTLTPGTIKKFLWFENAQTLGKYLQEHLPPSALILFKGSQNGIYLEEAIKPILLNPEDEKKLCRQESFWKKN